MAGVMFRDFTIPSGQSLKRADVGTGALIEAEVAFHMGSPLPVRDAAYREEELLDAVQSALLRSRSPCRVSRIRWVSPSRIWLPITVRRWPLSGAPTFPIGGIGI